jgi:hypothetical protein
VTVESCTGPDEGVELWIAAVVLQQDGEPLPEWLFWSIRRYMMAAGKPATTELFTEGEPEISFFNAKHWALNFTAALCPTRSMNRYSWRITSSQTSYRFLSPRPVFACVGLEEV